MKIPVTKAGSEVSLTTTMLIGVLGFALGISLGVIAEGPRIDLAAVGAIGEGKIQDVRGSEAQVEDESPSESEISTAISAIQAEETAQATPEAMPAGAAGEVLGAEIAASESSAASSEDAALAKERADQRIRALKDRGVALVAEFTHNCGNWDDACAIPYRTELEAINAAYRDAEAERATLGQY